ncbi:hypothetical protein M6B22_11195 [Jatrophihabitans cynanchi]|uniref:Conjugal transfer protein TrbL n=1 Tax=Jatrophihabitans cynanchi TaxID=2944128 RepID=A0ABY7JVK1_9ACTN|nr:hypothetical protein [Jatrophihabitans sp. SB3-54]WAX55126.1 hypothetical protein M6B22_11195 [Jatrophihabitans sp. SB3-54]
MSGCSINPLSWGQCVTGALGHVIGGAGKAIAGGVFDSIAHAFATAASGAVNWLWRQIGSATAIDLSSRSMGTLYGIAAGIGVLIALGLFAVQVIACAVRQDFGGLGRAARGVAVSSLGVIVAIGSVAVLLTAVDTLSNGVVQVATGTTMTGIGKRLVAADVLTGGQLNSAGMLLFSLVLLISVVIVWCALMIRKMLIVVAAVFAPIAFAGATSDLTRGWVRKWIEFTVALVFSKLILVIVFMIGLSLVNGAAATGGVTDHVTNLAIGALTLLLAGFAPWMAIRMVHFTGDHFGHLHSQAAAARAGGAAAVAAPGKLSATHSQATAMRSKITPTAGGFGSGSGPSSGKQPPPGTGAATGAGAAGSAAGMASVGLAAARAPGQIAGWTSRAVDQATAATPSASPPTAPVRHANGGPTPPDRGQSESPPSPPGAPPPRR